MEIDGGVGCMARRNAARTCLQRRRAAGLGWRACVLSAQLAPGWIGYLPTSANRLISGDVISIVASEKKDLISLPGN